MEQNEEQIEWLDPKAQAKYLGISLNEVYRHLRRVPPSWPFYRVTSTKRNAKKSDLDAFLAKVMVPAAIPEGN